MHSYSSEAGAERGLQALRFDAQIHLSSNESSIASPAKGAPCDPLGPLSAARALNTLQNPKGCKLGLAMSKPVLANGGPRLVVLFGAVIRSQVWLVGGLG